MRQRSGGWQLEASQDKIIYEILSRKNPSQKRAGGVAQGVGPEFKPWCCKKEKGRKEGRKKEGKNTKS
jgi:hypothetical protein